jgi:hypothetical protein
VNSDVHGWDVLLTILVWSRWFGMGGSEWGPRMVARNGGETVLQSKKYLNKSALCFVTPYTIVAKIISLESSCRYC